MLGECEDQVKATRKKWHTQ